MRQQSIGPPTLISRDREPATSSRGDGIALAHVNLRREKVKSVVRVAAGNFLEMYDFMIYGYYAAAIGRAFFPKGSEFASLMLSLGTFGAGFLMRPLGALTLGPYIDRCGCRAGLILTLGLMSIGTLSIALAPTYAAIGLFAPVIVVGGR